MGTRGYRSYYYYVTGTSIFRSSLILQARSQTLGNLLLKNGCHLLHVVSRVDVCVHFCATDSLTSLLPESFERTAGACGTGKSISPPHFLTKKDKSRVKGCWQDTAWTKLVVLPEVDCRLLCLSSCSLSTQWNVCKKTWKCAVNLLANQFSMCSLLLQPHTKSCIKVIKILFGLYLLSFWAVEVIDAEGKKKVHTVGTKL